MVTKTFMVIYCAEIPKIDYERLSQVDCFFFSGISIVYFVADFFDSLLNLDVLCILYYHIVYRHYILPSYKP